MPFVYLWLHKELSYTAGSCAKKLTGGFVNEMVCYMIMDDLKVMSMTTICSKTILNKFHMKETDDLEEKEVMFEMKEGDVAEDVI